MTDRLDRAILRGMMAIGGNPKTDNEKRTFLQESIADILLDDEGADCLDVSSLGTIVEFGYNLAVADIKRRAGLVKESNDEINR